jgi:hypothetical protein
MGWLDLRNLLPNRGKNSRFLGLLPSGRREVGLGLGLFFVGYKHNVSALCAKGIRDKE